MAGNRRSGDYQNLELRVDIQSDKNDVAFLEERSPQPCLAISHHSP
ncbi:MAG: hypothetical protein SWX82_11180 [Cyanobacteriota bacterium]|nr:hypothetical protein [Cyanobacteriota bacterium]